eukprot:615110-Alexandrium_andersonii.AAC.1
MPVPGAHLSQRASAPTFGFKWIRVCCRSLRTCSMGCSVSQHCSRHNSPGSVLLVLRRGRPGAERNMRVHRPTVHRLDICGGLNRDVRQEAIERSLTGGTREMWRP